MYVSVSSFQATVTCAQPSTDIKPVISLYLLFNNDKCDRPATATQRVIGECMAEISVELFFPSIRLPSLDTQPLPSFVCLPFPRISLTLLHIPWHNEVD